MYVLIYSKMLGIANGTYVPYEYRKECIGYSIPVLGPLLRIPGLCFFSGLKRGLKRSTHRVMSLRLLSLSNKIALFSIRTVLYSTFYLPFIV